MENSNQKNIIIGILTIIVLSLGALWYFDHSSGDKERKRLFERNEKLEMEKNKPVEEIIALSVKLEKLEVELKEKKDSISILDRKMATQDREISNLKSTLRGKNEERAKLKEAIEKQKNTPHKKGNFLLESVKNKTK
jgi:chromosome segregation ATPase